MNTDYSDAWTEYEREGEVALFGMKPPLLLYEREASNTRLIIGPKIHLVSSAKSPVTVEKLRSYGHSLPAMRGEYIQTILYDAMTAEGEVESHHIDSVPDDPDLPVVFTDAPIGDDRFADLDWMITVEYIAEPSRSDEGMDRPASRPTPKLSFRFDDRKQAVETLEALLSAEEIGFDLPPTISW